VKYISVCSGIEAATVAWHGLGWEPLAFGEIDAFPSAVLSHHYPEVPNLGDMSKFREWPEELLVECDLLVGGTPCQAFSVAGLRKSLEDDRGNLSLVYVQLFHHINEVRKRHGRQPAIALWENVPGVLSTRDNAFGCFVSGLLGVDDTIETQDGKWPKAGFLGSETVRVGYRVLDAQYFAVAQRRRRVFLVAVPCELVASLGGRACPSEILSLRESVLGNPPTRGAAWEGAARPTAASLTGSGRGVERCGESRGQDDVVLAAPQVANPLTARMGKGINTTCDEGQTPVVSFHPTQDPIGSVDGSTQAVAFQSNLGTRGGDIYEDGSSPTVRVGSGVGIPSPPAVAFTKSKRAQSENDDESWVPGEVAPTQNQFDVGDTRATTVVAFTQNCRDEVRQINGDGQIAGALAADSGSHQTNYVAYDITGTLATNGGKETDCHTALRSRPPGQSEASTTTVVAVDLQNVRAGGDIAGTLDTTRPNRGGGQAVAFTTEQTPKFNDECALTMTKQSPSGGGQPQCVAFANRTRDGVKVPEVMKDGVTPALTNPGGGGRSDAVNVAQAMSVRRLTPRECEFLQGFPPDYTLVTHRNKPAADGPRYRALGNSMAVPCMAWLGWRIHKATGEEP
jgi:DNA (cytosine-5)-methyltransferase 1